MNVVPHLDPLTARSRSCGCRVGLVSNMIGFLPSVFAFYLTIEPRKRKRMQEDGSRVS